MTSEFKVFTFAVYNTLGVGSENALTRKEICQSLKCGDRSLRRAIEYLRRDYPILTNDDGRGYYLATTDNAGVRDALSWLKRQDRRLRSIKASESGAIKFVGNKKRFQVPGQIEMFGGG